MTALNFKTYSDLAIDIRKAIHEIPKDIDLIVGNPRSGMIPAYMIGAFLNMPVSTLDEYLNNIQSFSGERPLNSHSNRYRKILVVDDSVNSGNALNKLKNRLSVKKTGDHVEYIFFAVYVTEQSRGMVDFYASVCEQPRIFQWNYLYHNVLSVSCLDIDGVLCVDPTPEQNDDGEKYIDFILNAKPLYIPNYKIKALVTSRLEKYRKQTEEWLKRNDVQYDELYMLDLPSKEERIRLGSHGKFKAEIYKKLEGSVLFVESEREQAIEIAEIARKPVISLYTDEFFSQFNDHKLELKDDSNSLNIGNDREILAKKEFNEIITSKSFLLGNLFFRSIKNPYKILTFPVNFLRILFEGKNMIPKLDFHSQKYFSYLKKLFSKSKRCKLVMTILARDEGDIVRQNIEFHLNHGVDFIIATDNGSIDDTRKIFKEYEKKGKLFLIDEPGRDKSQAAWNNRMMRIAIEKYKADMIFHCDADEFWYPKSGNLKNELWRDSADMLTVNLVNVLLENKKGNEIFTEDAKYAMVKPIRSENFEEDSKKENLYFFQYPPKVMFKTSKGQIEVTQGNHTIVESNLNIVNKISSDINIFHLPLRGKNRFFNKVIETGKAVEKNNLLGKGSSWHIRRWFTAYRNGTLMNEYEKLMITKEKAEEFKKKRSIEDFNFKTFLEK